MYSFTKSKGCGSSRPLFAWGCCDGAQGGSYLQLQSLERAEMASPP